MTDRLVSVHTVTTWELDPPINTVNPGFRPNVAIRERWDDGREAWSVQGPVPPPGSTITFLLEPVGSEELIAELRRRTESVTP